MSNCIFCQIIEKKIPAKIEYQDEAVLVFHDINPKAPVHLLIIPKEHISNINNFEAKKSPMAAKLLLTAKKMAQKMKIDQSGYRLIINNGADAGQEVDHLHIHLLGGKKLKF